MGIRKEGVEGRRQERWGGLSQTEKNGPQVQVAWCLKVNIDAAFGPLQNILFVQFVANI